jgi:hypothetical protein
MRLLQCKAFFWALAISTIVVSQPASAGLLSSCPLIPGGSCLPPDDAGDPPGTMVALKFAPFNFTTSAGLTHGVLKEEVFKELSGTFDFYYIVFNLPDSATSLTRESDLNFAGWATSVAFRSDGSQVSGFVDGNVPPSSADRDAPGSTVGFNFGPILPNQRSRVVVISTDALGFTTGQSTIDSSGPVATFQPATPEPASFLLLGCGLLLMTLFSTRYAFAARDDLVRPAPNEQELDQVHRGRGVRPTFWLRLGGIVGQLFQAADPILSGPADHQAGCRAGTANRPLGAE